MTLNQEDHCFCIFGFGPQSSSMTSVANIYSGNQYITMIPLIAMDMSVKLEHFKFRLVCVANRLKMYYITDVKSQRVAFATRAHAL